eukprot:TRINITY_DN40117_c0_g1_i1.p1 TRINITY_DN40117_c0_g1~~TRINITY_DN40117_c0_g1_i1.p1  ORF type:complete len:397 (+),score=44.25 TRINITY_DN40117_c0_g1_i1:164-1354(+)
MAESDCPKSCVQDIKSVELQTDLKALGLLVAEALKPHGWDSVDPASIVVEDKSSGSGNKTYKVRAAGVDEVSLHSRDSWYSQSETRTEAAVKLFGEHGVSPKRLAQGVDWFIEPWEGYGEPTWTKIDDMKVMGRELAKVHMMPIEWFDPFRAKLKAEHPCLASVPAGSHIWWYASHNLAMFADSDPAWMAEFAQPMFTPQSKAGARIVTCHGDIKEPNMISLAEGCAMKDGLCKFVDLDWAHVNAACHDLAFVCFHYYEDPPMNEKVTERDDVGAMRRAFLESYLEAMGDPSTKQDVDALLVDTALAACGHHFGIVGEHSVFGRNLDPDAISGLKRFKEQAAALLASDAEQARFHESGPEGWFALQGYDKLIKAECSSGVVEAFRFFSRIIECGSA